MTIRNIEFCEYGEDRHKDIGHTLECIDCTLNCTLYTRHMLVYTGHTLDCTLHSGMCPWTVHQVYTGLYTRCVQMCIWLCTRCVQLCPRYVFGLCARCVQLCSSCSPDVFQMCIWAVFQLYPAVFQMCIWAVCQLCPDVASCVPTMHQMCPRCVLDSTLLNTGLYTTVHSTLDCTYCMYSGHTLDVHWTVHYCTLDCEEI